MVKKDEEGTTPSLKRIYKAIGFRNGAPFSLDLYMIPGGFLLMLAAAEAFAQMYGAARQDGIELKVNTAFRDHEYQKVLHKRYLVATAKYVKGEGPKPAPVARPGYSNHQKGIAVDINRAPGDDLTTPVPDSPIDKWLNKNAKTYGFKRTVASEPWHWEYDSLIKP